MGESADPRLVESWEVEDVRPPCHPCYQPKLPTRSGCAQVGVWVTEIGFPQYKRTFEGNFISGWKLVNQFTSNAQLISMNIKDHDDHKTILAQVQARRGHGCRRGRLLTACAADQGATAGVRAGLGVQRPAGAAQQRPAALAGGGRAGPRPLPHSRAGPPLRRLAGARHRAPAHPRPMPRTAMLTWAARGP